jgi:nucleoside-diphosphate-sugar epimerase
VSELHVVLGASGALGSAIVHHLVEAEGLPVRAVARDANKAAEILPEGIEIVACDVVADQEGLLAACRGASVIYNCVYVTGQFREVATQVLAAAKQVGARLVQPSNGLVYGPLRQVPATEDHPQAPTSRRGMLRKEIEMTMLWAHERGEVAVVLPRLSTFYGAHVLGTFISAIFEAAYKDKRAFWLGRLDVPHDLV